MSVFLYGARLEELESQRYTLWHIRSHLGDLVNSGNFSSASSLEAALELSMNAMELEELVVIAVVPLLLGLVWNRWAGGASGFLMGSFYALYWANSFHGHPGSGTVLLAYILSAMLIGYIAGALNKKFQKIFGE